MCVFVSLRQFLVYTVSHLITGTLHGLNGCWKRILLNCSWQFLLDISGLRQGFISRVLLKCYKQPIFIRRLRLLQVGPRSKWTSTIPTIWPCCLMNCVQLQSSGTSIQHVWLFFAPTQLIKMAEVPPEHFKFCSLFFRFRCVIVSMHWTDVFTKYSALKDELNIIECWTLIFITVELFNDGKSSLWSQPILIWPLAPVFETN